MSIRRALTGRVALALVSLALVITLSSSALVQEASKVDIFAGFSWASPGKVNNKALEGENGWGSSVTYNLNQYVGLTADFNGHYSDAANRASFLFGPKIMYRSEKLIPFGEILVGPARISPQGLGSHWGLGVAAGGGFDLLLTKHFGIRMFQADYILQVNQNDPSKNFRAGTMHGARLQGGLVFLLGGEKPPVPVSASCSAQPTEIMAGEPVNATVTAANFNPKHTVAYAWKTTGGKLTAKDTTAALDTAGLAPGTYTITATVTDAKAKVNNTASCNASFTVKEPPKHPPTLSCSANPATVRSGDPSTVTAQSTNPDNRPLTYSWAATGGRITGTGTSVTLDTAGSPAGPISITGTVTDDRGLSASCKASVNVEVPPPPPQMSKLNEIAFPNTKKPARVDNTAKAILDDVALRLQREPDAKAVVVGYFDPAEKGGMKIAEERAFNTKEYLTKEKGIDPSRIEVRTGSAGGTRAEIYLVPSGATFNLEGTQTFDETTVTAPVKKPAKKPAKKATAPKA